jgi:hypothetical protein
LFDFLQPLFILIGRAYCASIFQIVFHKHQLGKKKRLSEDYYLKYDFQASMNKLGAGSERCGGGLHNVLQRDRYLLS